MKKEMILIMSLAVLMLFAVAPALAVTEKKVPVTATITGTSFNVFGTSKVSNAGVVQIRDFGSISTVKLYIAPNILPNAPDFTFTNARDLFGTVNTGQDIPFPGPWPEAPGLWHSRMIWTYSEGEEVKGTFEGEWNIKSVGWYIISPTLGTNGPSVGHAVLQGNGLFKGQTLVLDSVGPPSVFTGYLLTP